MIGGINSVSSQIASVYNAGSKELANTLIRISSGKKFQNASEDLVGFIRSRNIEADIKAYQYVKEGLTEFKAYTSAALEASSSVYEALTDMKNLVEKFGETTDTDLKDQYEAEFNSLKTQISTTLANTYVNGNLVTTTGSITTVNLNPEGTNPLDLNFSDIPTIAAGLLIDAADVDTQLQAEIDSTLTYMSEAKAFDAIADQQLNLTSTIINSKKAVMSLITDIDEAEETEKALDLTIRQQAAMSMLAQANIARASVAKLYE